jgi:hypothetical protein
VPRVGRPRGARLLALAAGLALVVVLSLDWFALDTLTSSSSAGFHASGWAGLGRLPVALLLLGALAVVVGPRLPAVVVCFLALVVLIVDLPLHDDLIAFRWPAYAGVALAIVLLGCAVWAWRRPGVPSMP